MAEAQSATAAAAVEKRMVDCACAAIPDNLVVGVGVVGENGWRLVVMSQEVRAALAELRNHPALVSEDSAAHALGLVDIRTKSTKEKRTRFLFLFIFIYFYNS